MDLRIGMSASPSVLPLSLIADHKVVGSGTSSTKPVVNASAAAVPASSPIATVANGAVEISGPTTASTPPIVASIPTASVTVSAASTAPVQASLPSAASVTITPVVAPPPPSSSGAQPAGGSTSSENLPQPAAAAAPSTKPLTGSLPSESIPVAPGSGSNTANGGEGSKLDVEDEAIIPDVPQADAQPCVPSATVPQQDQNLPSNQEAVSSSASNQPPPPTVQPIPADVAPLPAPRCPGEATEPEPMSAAATATSTASTSQQQQESASLSHNSASTPRSTNASTPASVQSSSGAQAPQETPKTPRTHKRKATADSEAKKTKESIKENDASSDDGRKSKRMRLPTQPYQSPIPELNIMAKINSTPKTPKPSEDKLIVFYRNEFLAVRNAEGGFYVCQTMQNIYRTSSKIKIRWLSQGSNDSVFTPDFYDTTDFDCILTNLKLDKVEKDKYKLPELENQRTQSILNRALDVEKGVAKPADSLTEEHPDGLDLSLYHHEDQLKRKKKKESNKKSTKINRSGRKSGRPIQNSGEASHNTSISSKSKVIRKVIQGKVNKSKKVARRIKKQLPTAAVKKKLISETVEKKESDKSSVKKSTPSLPGPSRRAADKTKSPASLGAAKGSSLSAASSHGKLPRSTRSSLATNTASASTSAASSNSTSPSSSGSNKK